MSIIEEATQIKSGDHVASYQWSDVCCLIKSVA